MASPLSFFEKLHSLHRAWRYRLNSEKESIRFLHSQNLLDKTALDIGGNFGVYSYWMSKLVGKQGKVVTFEPQPELAEYLESLRISFQLDNMIIVNKALSALPGKQDLYRQKIGDGGASLTDDAVVERKSIPVDVSTLDEYFSGWAGPKIEFIKCDVEGHELEVFKGGRSVLLKDFPSLLFECHQINADQGDVFSFLESLGYDGFFLSDGQKIHFSRFNDYPYPKPGVSHRNYIFVRKEV